MRARRDSFAMEECGRRSRPLPGTVGRGDGFQDSFIRDIRRTEAV